MKTKALKLPDGGIVNVPLPTEFGSPILALNGPAALAQGNPLVVYGIGIALGALGAYIFLQATK
jgi:hypothetical protein